MRGLLFVFTIVAGAAGACQAAANAALAGRVGIGTALLINSLLVTAATVVLFFASGGGASTVAAATAAPWRHFIGGPCGFAIIVCLAYGFPRIGAALAVALLVLGQGATALVIDHFGLWGTPVNPVSPIRLVGAALVAAGVLLLRR
jgi:transporter family-2 protein